MNNRTNRGLKPPLSQQRPESISSFIESKRAVSVRAQKKRVAREEMPVERETRLVDARSTIHASAACL